MHGILTSAAQDLFDIIDKASETNELDPASTISTSVKISCMELYNEELRDLLTTTNTPLSIQEDGRGNVQITNLSETVVDNIDDLMQVIQVADENRTVGSTAMNERSSRSHTIFRIKYEKEERTTTSAGSFDELPVDDEREDKENEKKSAKLLCQRRRQKVITTVSTLNLVDLAGSESVRVTGAKGDRQKEGGKINQRLV